MAEASQDRVHLIAGGFPPGSYAGHDHDYARLRLLTLLSERDIPATVASDLSSFAVVLLTDHSDFDYDAILEHAQLVVDTRGKYRERHPKVARA